MIGNYAFGRIEIAGRECVSDVIIYPDGRVDDTWWRRAGHRLCAEDIADLIAAAPEIIIAGTGANGMLEADADLPRTLARRGIAFEALPTPEAVARYNALCGGKKVGACLHLTC